MQFGLCNAPSTIQRLMQLVLSGLEWDCCFVYTDDILIASKSFEDHVKHLNLIFERLCKAGLHLKPTKCHFLRERVPYLGYIISKNGIQPDPSKTEVKNFPRPSDPTSVRSFVGLAAYYRRFVPQFAIVAAPLHRLMKKDVPFVVKKFHAYLLCHPCTVLTDHAACLSLLNTARPSAKLARWRYRNLISRSSIDQAELMQAQMLFRDIQLMTR